MQNKMAFSLSPFQNLFRYKEVYWNLLKHIANIKANEEEAHQI